MVLRKHTYIHTHTYLFSFHEKQEGIEVLACAPGTTDRQREEDKSQTDVGMVHKKYLLLAIQKQLD